MKSRPGANVVAGAVTASLLAGLAAFLALTKLSEPPRYRARVDAAHAAVRRAATLTSGIEPSPGYVSRPICNAAPEGADQLVRTELADAIGQSGLGSAEISNLDAQSREPGANVYPVTFTVTATGRYDLVQAFLGVLAQARPQIFADTLDLTPQTSVVSMKFTGRVVCRAGF